MCCRVSTVWSPSARSTTLTSVTSNSGTVIAWFATLIRGRNPESLHDFLAGFVRYALHVQAYLFLAANPYPAFFLGTARAYPVDLEIGAPAPQSRWKTLLRLFLAIPALLLLGALSGGGGGPRFSGGGVAAVGAFLTWFAALARGRAPRGLRDLTAWGLGYGAHFWAYVFLLTDRYPNSNPLFFLGGHVIRSFSAAMIWGIFVATYSSIFICSPMLIYMGVRADTFDKTRETEAPGLEAKAKA